MNYENQTNTELIEKIKYLENKLKKHSFLEHLIYDDKNDIIGYTVWALKKPLSLTLSRLEQINWCIKNLYIRDANNLTAKEYGYSNTNQIINLKFTDIFSDKTRHKLVCQLVDSNYLWKNVETQEKLPTRKMGYFLNNIIPVYKEKKISEFVLLWIDITTLKTTQKQLVKSEKLASLGEMSAIIAHEFNNILAIISILNQKLSIENISNKEDYEIIQEQINKAKDIINTIKEFAVSSNQKFEKCKIQEVINKTMNLQKIFLKKLNIEIEIEIKFSSEQFVFINKGQFQQVFLNLFNNAKHALKKITQPKIKINTKDENDKVKIIFYDNGNGIPLDKIDKIFDSFYTTKFNENNDKKGTGLGLSVSKTIVEGHGGTIKANSEKGEGTEFIITLPIYKE